MVEQCRASGSWCGSGVYWRRGEKGNQVRDGVSIFWRIVGTVCWLVTWCEGCLWVRCGVSRPGELATFASG